MEDCQVGKLAGDGGIRTRDFIPLTTLYMIGGYLQSA